MDVDGEKLEQVVLALFQMNLSDDSGRRAWKSFPWSVLDLLHEKGYISNRNESEISRVVRGGSSAVGRVVRETVCREKVATRPPGWAGVAV